MLQLHLPGSSPACPTCDQERVRLLAAQADAEGRADAHRAVEEAMEQEKVATAEQEENTKIASLLKDEKVVAAVKVLKEAGVL